MSIHPSSDLVADVVKAADPATSMAAAQRLTSLAGVEKQDTGQFSTVLDAISPSPSPIQSNLKLNKPVSSEIIQPLEKPVKAFKDLEQLLLRNLVETMLPSDAQSIFGHGTAGSMWKSMLADALATDLGKTVDLGIAKAASMRPNYSSSFNKTEHNLQPELPQQNYEKG